MEGAKRTDQEEGKVPEVTMACKAPCPPCLPDKVSARGHCPACQGQGKSLHLAMASSLSAPTCCPKPQSGACRFHLMRPAPRASLPTPAVTLGQCPTVLSSLHKGRFPLSIRAWGWGSERVTNTWGRGSIGSHPRRKVGGSPSQHHPEAVQRRDPRLFPFPRGRDSP